MSKIYFLPILMFFISCGTPKRIYLNENGKIISSREFQKSWRDMNNDFFRWDQINEEGKREAKLESPVYKAFQINYTAFKKKLETITHKKFPENQIFILDYTFVNDLCSDFSNTWNSETVNMRKQFINPRKEKIEETPNRTVLKFFEEGIVLENSENNSDEYFFPDKGNFLRNNLFTQSALCGSLAVITPEGQALIRNGEYSMLSMAEHLNAENWELFFPSTE